MPRQARLDAPCTLHDLMLRELAGGQIVADGEDRATLLARLGAVAGATGTTPLRVSPPPEPRPPAPPEWDPQLAKPALARLSGK